MMMSEMFHCWPVVGNVDVDIDCDEWNEISKTRRNEDPRDTFQEGFKVDKYQRTRKREKEKERDEYQGTKDEQESQRKKDENN